MLRNKKIIIVDDHPIYREGLQSLLLTIDDIETVEIADNGQYFIEKIRNNEFDIALVDIRMPDINGIELIRKAKVINSKTKYIILSASENSQYIEHALQVGASGYLVKNSTFLEIKEAMQKVISGHNYFSPSIIAKISNILNDKLKNKDAYNEIHLTDREMEILTYISLGWSRKTIAVKLFISERTVDKHKENLLVKTNSDNSIELVLFAIRNNLVNSSNQ